jgi:hypothetical protein
MVADAVVEHLISMKRLPESCRTTDMVDMSRVMLSRPSNLKMVGRNEEVLRVVESLTGEAGAAVVVGGPGEGKSTVAMEAGLELCKRGWFPGGAYAIDFLGERSTMRYNALHAAVCVLQVSRHVLSAEHSCDNNVSVMSYTSEKHHHSLLLKRQHMQPAASPFNNFSLVQEALGGSAQQSYPLQQ